MPMLTTLRMCLPVYPRPGAAADLVGKCRHAVEHLVHLRHDVFAVNLDAGAARRAQRDMQNRAFFGIVDLLATEHRVPPRRDAALFGERQEKAQCFGGDAVLRVVEKQAGAFGGEALRPAQGRRRTAGEDAGPSPPRSASQERATPASRSWSYPPRGCAGTQLSTLLFASVARSRSCQDCTNASAPSP